MKYIKLDAKNIKDCSDDYLIKKLDLPAYYGKNLDALYDCLTSISIETEIEIINIKLLDQKIYDVFYDASQEDKFLTLKIKE